ncbi:MAG: putative toxin-antitoxin system toxin component, PIN family [Terracidiphilus sp.]|nr:putative toxin-antitoxin system toxin component, PIN family [Terracidiphilus sp.]MDR3798791.1 putative toxin-antitoxin system toxin component, PIN family [Terracidiphilus sp.]
MLALRLILDTNVVVSAALQEEGFPRIALTIALNRPARLYVSQPILDEYTEVLSRAELDIPKGQRLRLLQLIKNRSFLIAPYRRLEVTIDPDDNIFIEGADAARADYLITGNRRHFPRFWKGTKVITPREFIEIAAPHLLRG